jgi:sugar/nucleoside kinase (ribokinase family)
LVFGKDSLFAITAHPCEGVVDPTGAGDSFAGAFLGFLDRAGDFRASSIRRAAVYGSVLASFTIEDFGIERLATLKWAEIENRFAFLKKVASV